MHDVELVKVFDTGDDLMEKFEGLWLLHSLILDDVVEKLATISILHDEVQLLGRLDDFIELDNVRVSDHLQDVDFSCDSFDIVNVLNLVFFENFDCYTFICKLMHSELDLAKSTFSDSFI